MLTGGLRMERRQWSEYFRALPAYQGSYDLLEAFARHPRDRERFNLARLFVHGVLLCSILRKTVISEEQPVILKARAKRPGMFGEFFRQLPHAGNDRNGKPSVMMEHRSLLP